MFDSKRNFSALEILESRIAPASLTGVLLPTDPSAYVKATLGAPIELHAGQVLTTGGFESGSYLLYLEKGDALVFITDLNNNKQVDFNEITGIAAGDGMRLTSYVDIHGDIVTNLIATTANFAGPNGTISTVTSLTLSDSDNNSANDDIHTRGDGRVLLNNTIEKVEFRSIVVSEISDQNGDGVVDKKDLALRQASTTYSLFGSIYAGKGFGLRLEDGTVDPASGFLLDSVGLSNFGFETSTVPSIGSIRVGSAVSGAYFSYGASRADDIEGIITKFIPPRGQAGGDILGVGAFDPTTLLPKQSVKFLFDGLYAGDGGIGARGGNVENIGVNGDDSGGYEIVAGKGGGGASGGVGGSIFGLTEFGSSTGRVVIRTGSGGIGATGGGGNAGDLTFNTFNVRGNVLLDLGSGGNGFTSGGNGASLAKGIITEADKSVYTPGNGYGTSHVRSSAGGYSATIGTQQGVDFDGDGFGDFVFTTKDTSQLVVMFGDGLGGLRTKTGADGGEEPERFYLGGGRNVEALVIADLNGDGHPDIAVGSPDAGGQAGVAVFISKYEHNGPGSLTAAEDVNRNGFNDHTGFFSARYSTLPLMKTGDPETDYASLGFVESPFQISGLTAGDYDGDGHTELAAIVTYYADREVDENGKTTSVSKPSQILMFLTPNLEVDNVTGITSPTGQFYADFGTKSVDAPGGTTPPQPLLPWTHLKLKPDVYEPADSYLIETSALSISSGHDRVFVAKKGANTVRVFDYEVRTEESPSPDVIGTFNLGQVDTDRKLAEYEAQYDPTTGVFVSYKLVNKHLSLTGFSTVDFTVVDYDNDGNADVVGISGDFTVTDDVDGDGNPDVVPIKSGGFINGSKGDGTGSGTADSTNPKPLPGPPPATPPGKPKPNPPIDPAIYPEPNGQNSGNLVGGTLWGIKSVDSDRDGVIDDLAVYRTGGTGGYNQVSYFQLFAGPQQIKALYSVDTDSKVNTREQVLYDTYYAQVADVFHPGFAVATPPKTPNDGRRIPLDEIDFGVSHIPLVLPPPPAPPDKAPPLSDYYSHAYESTNLLGFKLVAGNGGNSQLGTGGTGGFIGSQIALNGGLLTDLNPGGALASLVDLTFSGTVKLVAGVGGNGYAKGGAGGSIIGATVRITEGPNITLGVTLVGGDGGRSVAGAGGDGGDLGANSIDFGFGFFAGNGGPGAVGGRGGMVAGNGTGIYDSYVPDLLVISGIGGRGIKTGGDGGNIINFSPIISGVTGSVLPGAMQYLAGFGGNAVTGAGGNGGSIISSSPQRAATLEYDIDIEAGFGGNGQRGGNGGSVIDYVLTIAAQSKNPAVISVIAGKGGNGTSLNGGNGGAVSGVSVDSLGDLGVIFFKNAYTPFDFNRVLAGDGGSSAGAVGGNGGSVLNLRSSSVDGAFALAAGAGGKGLRAGGAGGNVNAADISIGASTSAKALAIAGAGGDATAFIANPLESTSDPNQAFNAYGGRVGTGGAGGTIDGYTQRGSNAAHVDLIAGNGGSTLNYGTVFDPKPFVGRGGSIRNINVAGDIGNLSIDNLSTAENENVEIKSYNDLSAGISVADFVNEKFRLGTLGTTLTDSDGNVGILVGAAGRNKAIELDPVEHPGVYTSQPATGGLNGDLINVSASNLLSAVAGNVDRIAAIHLTQGIRIPSGIIGGDKGGPLPADGTVGVLDYLLPAGLIPQSLVSAPVRDGHLLDGALVTTTLLDASGKAITLPGRVFFL